MILTLLAIFILMVGIFCLVIERKCYLWDEALCFIGGLSLVIGAIFSLVFIGVTFSNRCTLNIEYENKLAEKQMLEYRIEQGEEIAGNELLYTQVVEFNNELRSVKYWSKNPWTNWFKNYKIAEMDYIEICYETEGNQNEQMRNLKGEE